MYMATKKFKTYKLHFTSPLHLGDARDDYSVSLQTIASDTMYAALISCLAKLGEKIPDNGDLECTISSLFPFYQKNSESNAVYFFPKPLKQTLPTSEAAIKERKKVKKVAWLDAKYFSKALRGEQLFDEQTIQNLNNGVYLTDETIDKDFITSQVSPRVTVSRDGQEDAKPFYMDRIMFKDYSGLYFVVDGDTTLLDKAIALLQSEGIGTDRNVGNGYFEYETNEVEITMPEESDCSIILSSYIPESQEQLSEMLGSEKIAYDFQRRGGWITTPPHNTLRKKYVYAFTAGSVFASKCNGIEQKGLVGVDLNPTINWDQKVEHPIWRCGRAIFLPIKLA